MRSLRIVAFALAFLLLIPTLFACVKTPDNPDNQTTDSDKTPEASVSSPEDSSSSGPDESNTENIYEMEKTDFNTTINILYWEDVENLEFFPTSNDLSDSIENAIYERNEYAKEQLGIDFNWSPTKGDFSNLANFYDVAKKDIENEHAYDIFAGYSMIGAMLAINGCAENLLDESYNKYLDFSKPWWPKKLIDTASIKNKLYFCSGDISTNMLHMMYAIIYNKDLVKEYVTEDLYELVENKKWTLDKMFELCAPLKNEKTYDPSDLDTKYGFTSGNIHFDLFFTGCGINTIEKDKDGQLVISDSWGGSKADTLVSKLRNFLYSSGCAFYDDKNYQKTFESGQVMFTSNRVQILGKKLADQDDHKFGLLPAPMYDENQENYITCMAFPFTVYAISPQSHNKLASAATLSAMGLAAHKEVTPVLFEAAMKLKYADDEKDAQMYDIIHDTINIEVGRIFSKTLDGEVYKIFRKSLTTSSSTAYTTLYRKKAGTIESVLKDINAALDKLD